MSFLRPIHLCAAAFWGLSLLTSDAQIIERPRPAEWEKLVPGARFQDRFEAMRGEKLSSDTWGADNVKPRLVDNGIEEKEISYWGGNIVRGDDGKFHLFVCGWPESAKAGHMHWFYSDVYHTISDKQEGPYTRLEKIGPGHNPEIFRLKDGRYIIYVIDAYYISDSLNGPWIKSHFTFDNRDRPIIEGLSNLTFAKREDGSYFMICRGGGAWISRNGISPYQQISHERAYPKVEGAFEDPVVWKDNVQYHLIVNDWYGRIAYYLRSPDGITWVTDPGEAYTPGIAFHAEGKKEDWFKYERIKIFQNKWGQAIQANLAVVDVLKTEDVGSDNHSSKNISIPLNPGLVMEWVTPQNITPENKSIRVKVLATPGFNPHEDMDISSLRFGSSKEVNYGRGAKVTKTEKAGKDLILVIEDSAHGITTDEFAPKLLGKTKKGTLLYAFTRVPWVDYTPALLSTRAPRFKQEGDTYTIVLDIENFGLKDSAPGTVSLRWKDKSGQESSLTAVVPALAPYEKTSVLFTTPAAFAKGEEITVESELLTPHQKPAIVSFKIKPQP